MSDLASSNHGHKETKPPSSSSKQSTFKHSSRDPTIRRNADSSSYSTHSTHSAYRKDGDDSSEAETVIMENAPSTARKLKRLKRRRSSSDDNNFWSDQVSTTKTEAALIDNSEPPKIKSDSRSDGRKTSDTGTHSRHMSKSSQSAMSQSPASRSISPGVVLPSGHKKQSRSGRDANGRLKLQRMCDKGKYDEAKELILNGAEVNDRDYAGNTAIHEAALKGHTRIVDLLLKNGALIDIRSGQGDLDTPLIDAAANDHIGVVRLLLERGADPRIFNAQGKTSMDSIQTDKPNHSQIAKLLRESSLRFRRRREADRQTPSGDGSDDPDGHHDFMDPSNYPPGTFPLKISTDNNSVQSGNSAAPRRRGARAQAIRNDLLWMDLTTRTGREQVYIKAADGDMEFVGNFLENGWKPDADCLALAARHGHTDVVGLLLAFGADSDGLNEDGETALQQTIGRGHFATVKLLLDSGASPNVVTFSGKSCLDLAQESLSSDDKEVALIASAMRSYKKSGRKSSVDRERSNRHDHTELLERNVKPDRIKSEKNGRRTENNDRARSERPERTERHEKVRHATHDNDDFSQKKLKKRKLIEENSNDKDSKAVRREISDHPTTKKQRVEGKVGSEKQDGKVKGKMVSAMFKDQLKEKEEKRAKIASLPKERSRSDTSEKLEKKKTRAENDQRPTIRERKQPLDDRLKRRMSEDLVKRHVSDEPVKESQEPVVKREVGDLKLKSEEVLKKAKHNDGFSVKTAKRKHEDSMVKSSDRPHEYLVKPSKREAEDAHAKSKHSGNEPPISDLKRNAEEIPAVFKDSVRPKLPDDRHDSSLKHLSREPTPVPTRPKTELPKPRDILPVESKLIRQNSSESISLQNPHVAKDVKKSLEKEEEATKLRDLLIVKREKERKEREKKMLLQLEVEEKRKHEKRRRDEELEKEELEKKRQESVKQKARDAAAEQERQRQLQIRVESEARKNHPYGLRMANYGTRTIEETVEYLPLLARRFRSGAAAISTSDKMGCYVIDMQVALLLGVQNIYQSCELTLFMF